MKHSLLVSLFSLISMHTEASSPLHFVPKACLNVFKQVLEVTPGHHPKILIPVECQYSKVSELSPEQQRQLTTRLKHSANLDAKISEALGEIMVEIQNPGKSILCSFDLQIGRAAWEIAKDIKITESIQQTITFKNSQLRVKLELKRASDLGIATNLMQYQVYIKEGNQFIPLKSLSNGSTAIFNIGSPQSFSVRSSDGSEGYEIKYFCKNN